ncbi:MAG: hypothetical protein KatS3mg042_0001 [Rhodothermaceae bacterium]|nr:MAG: hypothetical protein KatS3mg042_0001 [Rhodothermaceae bacterium]
MRLLLPILCLALACGPATPPAGESETGETRTAFGAASGVTRAGGQGAQPRVIPLQALSGDVEILFGDPDTPGEAFVMRIRELPGTKIPLHTHPVDEHLTVVQGTFYFAVGETWESEALKEMRSGAYAFVPKGTTMFGYAPEGAIVQVHGVGPFHIHWRDGLKLLDDAGESGPFRFRKGEHVRTPRGRGTIRQGYASGTLVQYEIEGEGGNLFMADEVEVARW